MGWVHRHKRHGALLALAALALQIALAFGHVHLNNAYLSNLNLRASAAGSRAAITAQHHNVLAKASPQAPAQTPADDDDYCAICASIFLASTSLVSHAPPLPVPLRFQRIEHSLGIARGIVQPPRVAFQSRAPPIV